MGMSHSDIGDLEWSRTASLILRYFIEFDSFAGRLRHSGWR